MDKGFRDCLKEYIKIQLRASYKRTALNNQMILILVLVILFTVLSVVFL